ncbi:MAG: TIGR01777 family oxidoreductase [Pseudomonadota bacterium]
MNILLTGGTGFIGNQLTGRLIKEGHRLTLIGRSGVGEMTFPEGVRFIQGNTMIEGTWQDAVSKNEVIINLAGESIFTRWNDKTKKLIYDSRILTTRNIVNAIEHSNVILFNASAVGYYGPRHDEDVTEESSNGDDFLSTVCRDWEKEALRAEEKGVRVIIPRFGIVLGKGGGALAQMVHMFKKYLGGPLGSGKQWSPWIHMEDVINAVLFLLEKPEVEGSVNFCAPNPVRNKELADALGEVLNRPAVMPAPGFMVRLALGEFADILLTGQRVIPKKLQENGFQFTFPEIRGALRNLL